MTDDVKNEDQSPDVLETSQGHFGAHVDQECIKLSDNIFMFPERNIGQHDNIYEGEVRSSVYGVRYCVIKFAEISEQNIREAEILTKLGSHTNVIAIIQSGTYCDVFEDRTYIALDKCHNENLRQYLANRKGTGMEFDLKQAVDFANQIIVGVMYIHDNNVIHLDLKPSNILISQNLRLIKIADFGFSIIVKSPKSKVFHKGQFGTNGYRPVESFGNGEVSMRTDVFSLGTILKHLLSNGGDVFGCDEHTFIHNVKNDVTNTSGLLVDNPVTTEHLIKCMVRKDRLRRPTIWEVSSHPCWSGNEIECNFDYSRADEIDDNASDDQGGVSETDIDIPRQKNFLAKMREMGFNRKPTIVVFDDLTRHMHRFDIGKRSMTKMHQYSKQRRPVYFEATTFGEYIYIFCFDERRYRYRCAIYRLEYCDVNATWEKMSWPDWDEEKRVPRITILSDAIYLVGGQGSKLVRSFDPSSENWKKLPDKSYAAFPAVICSSGFLYCIGGEDRYGKATNTVERMDLTTMNWMRIANMKEGEFCASAAECGGYIYVFGNYGGLSTSLERYDPKVDQWTRLSSIMFSYVMEPKFSKAFAIGGDIYVVAEKDIMKYDVQKDMLSFSASYPTMSFSSAALVKMSA